MARTGRLVKEIIQEVKDNINSVASSAEPALNDEELFKIDRSLLLLNQLENHINRIKEEFIRTIDECSP